MAIQHPWPPSFWQKSPICVMGNSPHVCSLGSGLPVQMPVLPCQGMGPQPRLGQQSPFPEDGTLILGPDGQPEAGSLLSNMPSLVASLLGPVRLSCVSFQSELPPSLGMKPFTAQGKQSPISVAYNHRKLTASECPSWLCPDSSCDPGQGGPFLASVYPPVPLSWPSMLTPMTPQLPWPRQLTSSDGSAVMDQLRPSLLDPGVFGGVLSKGGKTVAVKSLVLPPTYVGP